MSILIETYVPNPEQPDNKMYFTCVNDSNNLIEYFEIEKIERRTDDTFILYCIHLTNRMEKYEITLTATTHEAFYNGKTGWNNHLTIQPENCFRMAIGSKDLGEYDGSALTSKHPNSIEGLKLHEQPMYKLGFEGISYTKMYKFLKNEYPSIGEKFDKPDYNGAPRKLKDPSSGLPVRVEYSYETFRFDDYFVLSQKGNGRKLRKRRQSRKKNRKLRSKNMRKKSKRKKNSKKRRK